MKRSAVGLRASPKPSACGAPWARNDSRVRNLGELTRCASSSQNRSICRFSTDVISNGGCNEHRFDELGEFVADDLNGPDAGDLADTSPGLRAVSRHFLTISATWSVCWSTASGWLPACMGPAPTPAHSVEWQQLSGSSARRSW